MKKETIAVIFGGTSGEHVVSLRSGASIMAAIDRSLPVVPVGITGKGNGFPVKIVGDSFGSRFHNRNVGLQRW